MYRGAGMYGGVARAVETGSYTTFLPGTDGQQTPDERGSSQPIIEISDKDYRSFCWPCHALEDTGDC